MDSIEAKRRLLDRRAVLHRLNSTAKVSLATVALDQSRVGRLSRMDAMQMQAMAQEEARRRNVELVRIGAALARLEAGEWGDCLLCDEPIGAKRLALDPSVPTCIQCAREAEL